MRKTNSIIAAILTSSVALRIIASILILPSLPAIKLGILISMGLAVVLTLSYLSYSFIKNTEPSFTRITVLIIASGLFSAAIAKLILAPALVPALMMFGGAAIVGGATFLVSLRISKLIARYNSPAEPACQTHQPAVSQAELRTTQRTQRDKPQSARRVTFADTSSPSANVPAKASAARLTLKQ